MSVVKKLVYYIGFKANTSGAKEAQHAADATSKAWDKLTGVVNKGAMALLGAAGALGYLVTSTATFAEEVDRSARGLDMTVGQFQEYKAAFDALGASTDDLMDALVTVADRAVDAMEGTKEYVQEFRRVGIAISELKGKKAHEIFDLFIDRATKVKDTLQVQAAAARLFGDDLGRRILPVMVQSSESFASLRELVRETGLSMDELTIKKLRGTAFEMRRTGFIVKALARDLAGELAPAATEVSKGLGDILTERAPGLMKFFDEAGEEALNWANKFVLAMKDINEAAGDDKRLGKLADTFYRLGLVIMAGIAGVSLIAAVSALAAAFSGITFPVIAAFFAVSSLLRYLEDLWVSAKGGESLIGKLASKFEWMAPVLKFAQELVLALEREFTGLGEDFRELLGIFTQEGPEGFSLLEAMLAVAHVAITVVVSAVIILIGAIIKLVRWVVRFGVNMARVFQTAVLHWRHFKEYFVESAKEFLAILDRLIGRFVDFGKVTGELTANELAAVPEGKAASDAVSADAAKQWSEAGGILSAGTMADLQALGGRAIGMDTSVYESTAMRKQLVGAAEEVRFGGRVRAGQAANVDTRINQVNINLPSINTDDPAAWGRAAGQALQDEVLYSEDVLSSGVP